MKEEHDGALVSTNLHVNTNNLCNLSYIWVTISYLAYIEHTNGQESGVCCRNGFRLFFGCFVYLCQSEYYIVKNNSLPQTWYLVIWIYHQTIITELKKNLRWDQDMFHNPNEQHSPTRINTYRANHNTIHLHTLAILLANVCKLTILISGSHDFNTSLMLRAH